MTADLDSRSLPLGRRELATVAALVLLAVLLRLAYTTYPRVVWGDEPFYLWLGQSLWAGDGYNIFGYSGAHFPPLFPALAGGLGALLGSLQGASNLLYVLCGALLVLPVYAMGRHIAGARAAWVAGLFAALYPALTTGVLAWGTMTEPLYLLLVAAAIYALMRGLEWGGTGSYLAMAALLGLAYLTRTEAVVFAALGFLLVAATRLIRGDRWAGVVGRTVAAGLIFLLVASPYLLYIHNKTGQWSLTGAAGMAFVSTEGLANDDPATFDAATWGIDPNSGEVYLFAPASEHEGLAASLLADPLGLLRRVRANLRMTLSLLLSAKLVIWPLAALAALGLFGRPWDGRALRGHLALIVSLASPLSYVPFFVQDRYLAGMLIPALVWMGAGAAYLGDWLAGSWSNLRARPVSPRLATSLGALPALLVALFLLWSGPRLWSLMQSTHSFQPGHLAAAADLRGRGVTAGDTVMSRYPAIAFHAGAAWAPTPDEAWPTVEAYARLHGARYLAMDGWEASLRPQLSFLVIPGEAPAGLRYLETVEAGPDPVVLYEFEATE